MSWPLSCVTSASVLAAKYKHFMIFDSAVVCLNMVHTAWHPSGGTIRLTLMLCNRRYLPFSGSIGIKIFLISTWAGVMWPSIWVLKLCMRVYLLPAFSPWRSFQGTGRPARKYSSGPSSYNPGTSWLKYLTLRTAYSVVFVDYFEADKQLWESQRREWTRNLLQYMYRSPQIFITKLVQTEQIQAVSKVNTHFESVRML